MVKIKNKKCYLCGSENILQIEYGVVRDMPAMPILKCFECGFVFLFSFDHIKDNFYQESRMRKEDSVSDWDWHRCLMETHDDDNRRFEWLKLEAAGKSVLDFGSGTSNFLNNISRSASRCVGVEKDREFRKKAIKQFRVKVYDDIDKVKSKFDIITMFHCIEHLKEPIITLRILSRMLKKGGKLFIETPNSDDALISLYQNKPFSKFYYLKSHLFLFNAYNLSMAINHAGMSVIALNQIQRYPLSNTLYWLAKGKPRGHEVWSFLNNDSLNKSYELELRKNNSCDTLWAVAEKKR